MGRSYVVQGARHGDKRACKYIGRVTVNDLQYAEREKPEPGIVSLKKLCDGWEISLREFFDSDLFDDLEQEIK